MLCHDWGMRNVLVLAVVGLLAALAAGPAAAKTVRLTAKAKGTQVTLSRGDLVRITLTSNPSTGYMWQTRVVTRSVLKPVSATYKGTARLPGGGGTQTLTFRAVARGTAQLGLVYVQAGSANVGKRFRLTVVVR